MAVRTNELIQRHGITGKRDRIAEISQIKERGQEYAEYVATKLDHLNNDWQKVAATDKKQPDFYAIRAVTIIEVFTRQQVRSLVDHDSRYAARAALLMRDYKIDYEILRGIQGKLITLGDIVGHSIPVNSFGQIIDHFKALLDKPIQELLQASVDRWRTEVERLPPEPIIPDYSATARILTRLFDVRHILCHEIPNNPPYELHEISEFLIEGVRFVKALGTVLHFEMYGPTPLTQTDMNIDAVEKLKEKEARLNSTLDSIPERLHVELEELSLLRESQAKWAEYRNAWSDFETWPNQGGTIRPLLWASSAMTMTERRIEEIEEWVNWTSKLRAVPKKADK